MKTDDAIFSRRELRTVAGFVALYAVLAVGSQVLIPTDDSTSPSVHLRPAISASPADETGGVVEAVPLAPPTGDPVSTG